MDTPLPDIEALSAIVTESPASVPEVTDRVPFPSIVSLRLTESAVDSREIAPDDATGPISRSPVATVIDAEVVVPVTVTQPTIEFTSTSSALVPTLKLTISSAEKSPFPLFIVMAPALVRLKNMSPPSAVCVHGAVYTWRYYECIVIGCVVALNIYIACCCIDSAV